MINSFIHGGAWRDPLITKSVAKPLFDSVLSRVPKCNAASINYRLSHHPSHPDLDQSAKHPDHANDVRAALSFLQKEYGMDSRRCILVGHSAGAFIAFQVETNEAAVVGVEGIYDLIELVKENHAYGVFVESAFGPRSNWDGARASGEGTAEIVLVQSLDDELLGMQQTTYWGSILTRERGRQVKVVETHGSHNDVVTGADLVEVVLDLLSGHA